MNQRSLRAMACWLFCLTTAACGSSSNMDASEDEAGREDAGDDAAQIKGGAGGSGARGGGGGAFPDAGAADSGQPGARVINIQPLGDSITQGSATAEEFTYRRPLWKKLKAAGYKVDFVGSIKTQNGGLPHFYDDYDPDHEGHYGWTIKGVLPMLAGWLTGYSPDVSLILLGANDTGNTSAKVMLEDMEKVINILRAKNPRIIILLGQLIRSGGSTPEFNAALPAFGERLSTERSPIVVVNLPDGFLKADAIGGGIHPNATGSEKLATKWFDALVKVLPPPSP